MLTTSKQLADKLNSYMQSYPVDFVLPPSLLGAIETYVEGPLHVKEIKRDPTGQRLLVYLEE